MNIELVEIFISGSLGQGSAKLKMKYYNPQNLIVQYLPVNEKVNNIENNRMGNG